MEEDSFNKEYFKDIEEISQKAFWAYYAKTFSRLIPLSLTNATPSMFYHWKKKGLVNFDRNANTDKRTRVKLNLIEALWVKMLYKLRTFGLDIESLKIIHEELFGTENEKKVLEAAQHELDQMITVSDNEDLNELLNELSNEGLHNHIPSEFEIAFSYFGALTSVVIIQRQNIDILIYLNQDDKLELDVYKKEWAGNEKIQKIKTQSYISISLLNLIYEVFEEANFESILSTYDVFDNKENTILTHLRNKNVKEIIITRLNDEEYKIVVVENQDVKGEQVNELKKIFGLNNYKTVKLITRNNKHVLIEKTHVDYGKL